MDEVRIARREIYKDIIEFTIKGRKYIVLTSSLTDLIERSEGHVDIFYERGGIEGSILCSSDSHYIILEINKNIYPISKVRINNILYPARRLVGVSIANSSIEKSSFLPNSLTLKEAEKNP